MSNRYYQYRITLNGDQRDITDFYPEQTWHAIAKFSETHYVVAKLERRSVADYQEGIERILPGIRLDDLYISNWQSIAELQSE